jgi:hypothetical protein
MITIFQNQTANGLSDKRRLGNDRTTRHSVDGIRLVIPTGTFGGATITLRVSANGQGFANVVNNTITVDTAKEVYLPDEVHVQAEVTGATATTDISLHIA